MFQVLIHPGLYQALKRHTRAIRDRFRKTASRLAQGLWGGGTRVKRLVGLARPLYEARLDAGNRVLFTMVPSADRGDPKRLAPHLLIWDLVEHDAVKRAGRRNLAPEAEFLELSELEEYAISEPPPCPEAELAAFPEGNGEEGLLHFLLPPEGFEAPAAEGIDGGVRWFYMEPSLLVGEDEFQRLLDEGGDELELKLTREQYEILRAPGPVLLAGSAGSGKTTIAIHRLAEAAGFGVPAYYLSYSPWLKEHAIGLYGDLLAARGFSKPDPAPRFRTFDELFREVGGGPEDARASVDFGRFEAWLRMSGCRLDPALAWEEIRGILKGACRDLDRPMLDRDAYLELGRKRAPLFVDQRPEIYRFGVRYQEWLASQKRIDQIDACRNAFRVLARSRPCDPVVICDEVQDLTELEVAFLLALAGKKGLGALFFAGDTQQIVNPSGFRWAEVRGLLRESRSRRECPEVLSLRRNYRSVAPLVELAGELLTLRRELFGRSEADEPEEAVAEGPIPVEVTGAEEAVLEAIAGFGPRSAVLVLDEAEARRLQVALETTRVFTVTEAKGLEFETVILWKALASGGKGLKRLLDGETDLAADAWLKRFLQHLYVAVTRARRHLALYEGETAHPFWALERFRGRLEPEGAAALPRLFRSTASPEKWAQEGRWFLKRNRFRQAAECFRRAGLPDQEREALGLFAETLEEWAEAAAHWSALGDHFRLAPVLERLGRFEEAGACYRKIGKPSEAVLCEARGLESKGLWEQAARLWQEAGRTEEALRCHQKAGNREQAFALEAAAAEKAGEWARAAKCHEAAGDFKNASRCLRRAGDSGGATRMTALGHEQAGRLAQAAQTYARAGFKQEAAECRARMHEEAGAFEKAARAWEQAGNSKRARACRARARGAAPRKPVAKSAAPTITLPDPKTIYIEDLEDLEDQGQLERAFALAGHRLRYLNSLKKPTGERQMLYHGVEIQELFELMQRCEARQAESVQDWAAAAAAWRKAREPELERKAKARLLAHRPPTQEVARAWMRIKEFKKAAGIFAALGMEEEAVEAHARRFQASEKWAEAADLWRGLGREKEMHRCLAQQARQRRQWAEAAEHHLLAGQATLAAEAQRRIAAQARRQARQSFELPFRELGEG